MSDRRHIIHLNSEEENELRSMGILKFDRGMWKSSIAPNGCIIDIKKLMNVLKKELVV